MIINGGAYKNGLYLHKWAGLHI